MSKWAHILTAATWQGIVYHILNILTAVKEGTQSYWDSLLT
jgi:hypothetical protein